MVKVDFEKFNQMTVKQLKQYAREHGLKRYLYLNKEALVKLLQPHLYFRQNPSLKHTSDKNKYGHIKFIKRKINGWYNWLSWSIPESQKVKTDKSFKTFKNKDVDLYEGVKEERKETEQVFIPIEEACDKAYKRYRINATRVVDVDGLF